MNNRVGIIGSAVTLAAVIGFALSMIIGADFLSYLASMFIAWGFVPMICALAADSREETKAAGYTAIVFAAVYAVFIMMVYFTQLTTVRQSVLTGTAAQLLDYQNMGLFFSYDLLGYGFMALSTFFAALTIRPQGKADRWLKGLLLVHGVFAVGCVLMPMLGVFTTDMAGGDLVGIMVLEFWCAYFIPVCILSWRYFAKKHKGNVKI